MGRCLLPERCRSRSWACRSLSETKPKGVISLQNVEREGAFDESDLRLLTTLASSMSVSVENVRLFDETRGRDGRSG